jgi:hypothetical protein
MKRSVILLGVLVVACSMLVQAQAPVPQMSPFLGVWKVNADKSTYFPGPRPAGGGAGQSRQYVDRGAGVIAEIRINISPMGTLAFGNVWSGKFDGSDAPVFTQADLLAFLQAGTKPMGTRAYKVVDAYTTEQTNKTGAAVNNTVTTTVSRDGKTLTETVKAFDAQGQQNAMNVIVYDRQ